MLADVDAVEAVPVAGKVEVVVVLRGVAAQAGLGWGLLDHGAFWVVAVLPARAVAGLAAHRLQGFRHGGARRAGHVAGQAGLIELLVFGP